MEIYIFFHNLKTAVSVILCLIKRLISCRESYECHQEWVSSIYWEVSIASLTEGYFTLLSRIINMFSA